MGPGSAQCRHSSRVLHSCSSGAGSSRLGPLLGAAHLAALLTYAVVDGPGTASGFSFGSKFISITAEVF